MLNMCSHGASLLANRECVLQKNVSFNFQNSVGLADNDVFSQKIWEI